MHLTTILREYGLNPEKVKMIRHPLSRKDVSTIYQEGFIEAYQAQQGSRVFDHADYVVSFIGETGTTGRFLGVYQVKGRVEGDEKQQLMPVGYPYPEHFSSGYFYILEKTEIMSDLVNRLVIEWDSRIWHQWGTTDKNVIAIESNVTLPFPGYEKLIVGFEELNTIVSGDIRYEKWRDALSNVNCVYLICDLKYNKQYIGSTYGSKGILGRWTEYVRTYSGGNVEIIDHLSQHKDAYKHFQFTILKILPPSVSAEEAIENETLFKKKLNTRNSNYGLNKN